MHTIDFTFPQIVDLEGRHLLGEDGLGQVEKGGVIDGEVTIVLVQNPHCCSLNTTLHETEEENKLPPLDRYISKQRSYQYLTPLTSPQLRGHINIHMRKW